MWDGVRLRVQALREAPGAKRVFGAHCRYGGDGHGFELSPPAREAAVIEFEQAVGVRLPEDYRAFLLEVSAGGAGPYYGLTPFPPEDMDDEAVRRMRTPFRPEVVQQLLDALDREEPEADAFADEDAYDHAHRAWVQRGDELCDEMVASTLQLSHQGCGYFDLLVLRGPERGTVWESLLAADEGVRPLGGGGDDRVTFRDWYLGWLEKAEREASGAA